jgi:hypothetical protein
MVAGISRDSREKVLRKGMNFFAWVSGESIIKT